jgi:hypothetical protein
LIYNNNNFIDSYEDSGIKTVIGRTSGETQRSTEGESYKDVVKLSGKRTGDFDNIFI